MLKLLAKPQLCFEAVWVAIEAGRSARRVEHPNSSANPGQRILVVRLPWLRPLVR